MNSGYIQSIRSRALRCRELAETASDAEVAEELLRIASEIESAIAVLGDKDSMASLSKQPDREDAGVSLMRS